MDDHSSITSLLTEIRNNQLEEIEWRKRAVEESIRLQRIAIRRQSIALFVGAVVLAIVIILFAMILF